MSDSPVLPGHDAGTVSSNEPGRIIGYGPMEERALAALRSLGLPDLLAAFSARIVGSVPLGLALPGSDLEIACEVRDLEGFQRVLRDLFGDIPGAWTIRKRVDGVPAVVAGLTAGGFPVEIVGQRRPVDEQESAVRMVVEERLLKQGGEPMRLALLALRQAGMKTEHAFADYLGLKGDPARVLLELASLSDAGLASLVDRRRGTEPPAEPG